MSDEHRQPGADTPAADGQTEGIGRARMVRFAALLAVLLVLIFAVRACGGEGTTAPANESAAGSAEEAAATGETGAYVNAALEQVRDALQKGDLTKARKAMEQLGYVAPENAEARRLGVAFLMLACIERGRRDDLGDAVDVFNNVLPPESVIETLPDDVRKRAAAAMAKHEDLAAPAARPVLGGVVRNAQGVVVNLQSDAGYLEDCVVLWNIARAIADEDTDVAANALRLCNWFALHMRPWIDPVATAPLECLRRGAGTPVQCAWAYAELATQMGIRCRAIRLTPADPAAEPECLVQVYPFGRQPFLVNPYRAVAVRDADGKLLSLSDLAARPGAYSELLATAGIKWEATPGAFDPAGLQAAVHPRAFYDRTLAFASLIDVLGRHPIVAFNVAREPADEPLELWAPVMEELRRAKEPDQVELRIAAYATTPFIAPARERHLVGSREALNVYDAADEYLRGLLPDADVPEARNVMTEAIEAIAFHRAEALFDEARTKDAAEALEDYLKQYPQGPRRPLALALLAEARLRGEDTAGARKLLADMPPGRRLYGLLRLKALDQAP